MPRYNIYVRSKDAAKFKELQETGNFPDWLSTCIQGAPSGNLQSALAEAMETIRAQSSQIATLLRLVGKE